MWRECGGFMAGLRANGGVQVERKRHLTRRAPFGQARKLWRVSAGLIPDNCRIGAGFTAA